MSSERLSCNTLLDLPGDWCELQFCGEIDLITVPLFRERLYERAACSVLVIDLSLVSFMDSTGYGAILGLSKRRRQEGVTLLPRLKNVPHAIARMLRLTRLAYLVEIVGELPEPPIADTSNSTSENNGSGAAVQEFVGPPLPPLRLEFPPSISVSEAARILERVPSDPCDRYGVIIFDLSAVEKAEEGVYPLIRDSLCGVDLYGPAVEVIGGPWRFPRYSLMSESQIRTRIREAGILGLRNSRVGGGLK